MASSDVYFSPNPPALLSFEVEISFCFINVDWPCLLLGIAFQIRSPFIMDELAHIFPIAIAFLNLVGHRHRDKERNASEGRKVH